MTPYAVAVLAISFAFAPTSAITALILLVVAQIVGILALWRRGYDLTANLAMLVLIAAAMLVGAHAVGLI